MRGALLAALSTSGCFGTQPDLVVSGESSDGSSGAAASSSQAASTGSIADDGGGTSDVAGSTSAAGDETGPGDATGSSVDCMIPPPGIAAWWRFEGDLSDQLGSDAATPIGMPGFPAEGAVGSALACNGIDDAALVATDVAPAMGDAAFSIEAWVLVTQQAHPDGGEPQAPDQGIVSKMLSVGGVPNADGWRLFLAASGEPRWVFCLGGAANGCDPNSATPNIVIADAPATIGAWVHLVGVREATMLHLFVDGEHAGSSAVNTPSISDAADLVFGASTSEPDGPPYNAHLVGRLDEVTIYGRALVPEEIAALADASGGKCAP